MLFIWGAHPSVLTWKERSYHYIVASVSCTGSLGPSSRDIRGRVSPLGQPHLPVCQMNGVWGVALVASGKGLDREIDQCSWVASTYCWSLLLLFPLPKSVSSHTGQTQKKKKTNRHSENTSHQQRLDRKNYSREWWQEQAREKNESSFCCDV